MHSASMTIKGLLEGIKDYNIKTLCEDFELKPIKKTTGKSKNFIKVSAACVILDVKRPKFYKLAREGFFEIHYIGGDPNNSRVRESEILGLMTTVKKNESKRGIIKAMEAKDHA
jgi:hypothetical protein